MSTELGQQLAEYQTALAVTWKNSGPDAVHTCVTALSHEQLVALVMVNVGAQAAAI